MNPTLWLEDENQKIWLCFYSKTQIVILWEMTYETQNWQSQTFAFSIDIRKENIYVQEIKLWIGFMNSEVCLDCIYPSLDVNQ